MASDTVDFDTTSPTVAVSVADATLNNADTTSLVTFTFSEAPIGFTDGDITVVGGTLSPVAPTSDPLVYTATFTADANFEGNGSVTVTASSYIDAAGNAGGTATDSVAIDTLAPDVSGATVVVDDTTDNVVNAQEATAVSYEVTGLSGTGTLVFTDADGTEVSVAIAGNGIGTANLSTLNGAVTSSLIVTDAAGNTATVAGNPIEVDTSAPTGAVVLDAIATDNIVNTAEAGGTITVTDTVTGEFSVGDVVTLTLDNQTVGTGAVLANETFSIDVAGSDLASATVSNLVASVAIQDAAGNTNTITDDQAYTIDTVAPTVTVAIVDASLNAADRTSEVTFTFSEAPIGFTNSDVALVGGTLSTVTVDSINPLVYTATFTATAGFNGTGSVTVTASTYADAAGNDGAAGNDTVAIVSPGSGGGTPTPPPVTEGTSGNDNIAVGTSTTPIFGGAGADQITATPSAGTTAQLYGGSGFLDPNDAGDTISVSGAGSAVVYGNGGDDQIVVTSTGAASVFGGVGDDQVTIRNDAANQVTAGPGADVIQITGNGNNQVLGGSQITDPNDGADRITITGNGNNLVYANGGDDVIVFSGTGNNTVYAGVGNDTMTGGSGSDVFVGGPGDNVYTGGAGSDTFVFTAGSRDIITDFSFAQGDRLNVGGQAYSVTTASDGSAALVFADGGVIILQGVTQAQFTADFVA